MMSGNQKGFSSVVFAFALVTLLSCFSPVSSYFTLPRVSRTSDAIIIDYEGVGYSPFSVGRVYGQVVDPGFVPLPAFNPYGMFYGGWPHFGRQAAAPACGKGPTTFPTTRELAISERIAGGTAAKKGAWPFLVLLRKNTDAAGVYFCSGSLISDSKILLAAQCLEKLSVYEISAVTVLVGSFKTDLTDVQMTRRISKVVIHSGYNAATFANDIAIVTLDMPVILSKTVSTVCLAPAGTDPDQYQDQAAIVLGWDTPAPAPALGPAPAPGGGRRRRQTAPAPAPAAAPATLQQGLVAILGSGDCRADSVISQYSTTNTMCVTSGTGSNIFTCLKDVGGPVVINTAPATAGTPAVYTQVGINSYTKDCASTGLKTRVAAYADWIKTYSV